LNFLLVEKWVIGKRFSDWRFVYEDDVSQVAQMEARLLSEKGSKYVNLSRHYTKEGKIVFCEWSHSVRLTGDKQPSFLSFVQDITSRVQMREALRESEELYRRLSENAHDLIAIHKVDGTFLYLSHAVMHLLGYQQDELIGSLPSSLFHPEDSDLIQGAYEKSKVGRLMEKTVEYRIRHKEGRYVWFETYFNSIMDNNNQIIKLVTSSRDITQRKQQEAALRESTEKLQQRNFELNQLYEFSQEISCTLSVAEVINVLYLYLYRLVPSLSCSSLILADENWRELCIVSRHTLSLPVIDEIRDELAVILTELGEARQLTDYIPISILKQSEIPTSEKDIQSLGTKRNLPLIDSPSKNALKKESIGVLWLGAETSEAFTDEQLRLCYTLVNQLVSALERIRAWRSQEQQRLENLVQYLPTGVVLLDTEQHIVLANPVAMNYLPITKGNHPVLMGEAATVLAPLFDGNLLPLFAEPLQIDNRVFELTARPLDTGPYTGNYIMIIQDVTERKRMEAELETERACLSQKVEERTAALSAANVKLEKANRLKDEFLANMSHELRTPLNSILGGAEILKEQVYGSLNNEQLKAVQIVHSSGTHLLSLIKDILELSKIEAGKVELQYDNFKIYELCQNSLLFIKQLAHKKQIQVTLQIDNQLEVLYADMRRVKQILINLLTNAVKFTPEEGSVVLEVTSEIEKKAIYFSVIDTGIGIAEEDMPRLFKPFEQIDSGLARQYEGTGLGLALVQKLVDLHGGSISVESQKGQGSRFTVSLPHWLHASSKTAVDNTLLPQSAPAHRSGALKLILLAEDNPTTVDIFVDYLHHLDYRINVAGTGSEVLERLDEERPDLIIMDIQMPGMNGLEATRRIRADAQYKTLPIIALTALTMQGDRERCLEAGVNDYLSKPVSIHELMNVIEEYL
jgi:PAS domain S-box-containing protein